MGCVVIWLVSNISQAEVEKIALADTKVVEWLGDKKIKKIIYVKNKILNMVVE